MSYINHVLNKTMETAPALDLDGTTDLDDDLVPGRRRPALSSRDSEQSAARRTRSASRSMIDNLPVWPVQGPVTRATGAGPTSVAPKLSHAGAAASPVLVPLTNKQ